MIKTIQRFFYCWIFLTKLPAPPLPRATNEDWGRILPYFVLVGFVLSSILYILSNVTVFYKLPVLFSSLLVLLIWNLMTGSLHLDGLMDTFDGINCQQEERKLEAMKDSRIGAFGAIAGIFIILFKLVAICTLLLNKLFFVILISVPLSRLICVYSFTFLNKNKNSGATSSLLLNGLKKPFDFLFNLFLFILISFIIFMVHPISNFQFPISNCLLFVMLCFISCLVWAHWLDRHFKGLSGDTFGALIELSETTILSLGVMCKQLLL